MPGTTFDVRVEPNENTTILRMSGDVNRGAQEGLYQAYARSGDGAVLLDFSEVDYINSTGIAVIVGLLARARAEGRTVGACGLTDHYRKIFHITRIADFMSIYDDESAAMTAG